MNIEIISQFIIFLGLTLVLVVAALAFIYKISPQARRLFSLIRHEVNPIISPVKGGQWNEIGTFNPAALLDEKGNVHLVYRAVGDDGISRFGYAASSDGFDFKDRCSYPVFAMQRLNSAPQVYQPTMYPSGGSWGGCEDPRVVRIDGKIYTTFNAFDGWDFIRVALVSIDEKDFLNKKWKWSQPQLISPPNQVNKNWVMFPEKIKGKFAILHSISPEVQIDFVDKMEDLSNGTYVIKSKFGQKAPRKSWDTYLRGAGPPPIKTDKGWLVLYHAIESLEPDKYKLGAMLLALDSPQKVIARTPGPILFSDTWYENDWKQGVVYACGAIVKNEDLVVYYGGGDKHVCVAHTPLNDLLNWMEPV